MLLRTLSALALGTTFLITIPQPEAQAGNAGKIIGGLAAGAAAGYIAHKVHKHHKKKKQAQRKHYQSKKYTKKRHSGPVFSQAVFDTQTRLATLGYDPGPADGLSGRKTRQAIRQFQVANGQPATGNLSNPQIALLHQQSNNVLAGLAPNATNQVAAVAAPQAVAPQVVAPQAVAPATAAVVAPAFAAPAATTAPDVLEIATTVPTAPTVEKAPSEKTLADRPAVFGLTVGNPLSNVSDTLKSEGFDKCENYDNAIFCERATGFGSDKIAVAGSGDKIHTITRKLAFDEPIATSKVYSQMPASYASLLNSEDKVVAASPACKALIAAQPGTFDALVKQSVDGAKFDASAIGFSHACNYYFAINMEKADSVQDVELTFFDAAPVLASLKADPIRKVEANRPAQGDSELKF